MMARRSTRFLRPCSPTFYDYAPQTMQDVVNNKWRISADTAWLLCQSRLRTTTRPNFAEDS